LAQVLEIKVGVDLGRAQAGMAEHLLHRAKILAGFKHMRGKRVPEEVGVNGNADALLACPVGYPELNRSRP
jgi:hypothetical protein